MKSKIILAAALVALMAAGCNKSVSQNTDNSQAAQDSSGIGINQNTSADANAATNTPVTSPTANAHYSDGSEADVPPTGAVKEIMITSRGFSPASVTINKGDYVKFTNQDTAAHWPASDPHPTHTGYPGFDALKALAQGETYTFQFQKAGTWGFHDHMHPTTHGTVIVK